MKTQFNHCHGSDCSLISWYTLDMLPTWFDTRLSDILGCNWTEDSLFHQIPHVRHYMPRLISFFTPYFTGIYNQEQLILQTIYALNYNLLSQICSTFVRYLMTWITFRKYFIVNGISKRKGLWKLNFQIVFLFSLVW